MVDSPGRVVVDSCFAVFDPGELEDAGGGGDELVDVDSTGGFS